MTRTHCRLAFGTLIGLLLVAASGLQAAESDGSGTAPPATIRLANGNFIAGQLMDSARPEILAWQSPAFAGPFQFPLNHVNTVNFPIPEKLPQPVGDYGIELIGGDTLFGTLKSFTGDDVELDVPGFGILHVSQSVIRRVYRWNEGAELVYFGPGGLSGWKQSIVDAWRDEAGHLISSNEGASVSRQFRFPAQVRVEVELTWTRKPDFEMTFGESPPLNAFRFEVWENDLVAACESDVDADVKAIQPVKAGAGGIHLQLFLDQPQRRMRVYAANGDPLADLTLGGKHPLDLGKFQLTNKSGNIRLERVRVSKWTGDLPRAVETNKSRVHLTDGTFVYGRIHSYDATRREYVISDGTSNQTLAENRIQDIYFTAEKPAPVQMLRVTQLNGLQFSGDLVKVEKENLWVKVPGIREPLVASVSSLHSLVVLHSASTNDPSPGRSGRLETEGTVLHGALVNGNEDDAGCLVWQPVFSAAGVPLIRGVNARIIYRDPIPSQSASTNSTPAVRVQVGGFAGQIQQLFGGSEKRPAAKPRLKSKNAATVLHLRSGDTIPCTVTGIDEEGVTFTTTVSDATFVKHQSIKVLELEADAPAVRISKAKKERLLVLPRMQRGNPPTQLIRSVTGDYLRGRLVAMNDKELRVELRLEEKTIPRDTVTRIIWLHPDEIEGANAKSPVENSLSQTRVQAIPSSGNRLTFFAEKMEGTILSGKSEVLGNCHVDVTTVDQLLIGPAIEQAASSLAFHQWRLTNASEPLGSDGEGDPGSSEEGRDSTLVGKDAPPIELDLLDGTKFRLAEHKGKIVILDFWASWCGPCLQAMPQVDRVAHEFADQGVELFAINLEETPEKVKGALERLKLETTVALDQNGRVAERYGVTSIPQTVIIDREGKIVRLFVGGGARFDEQIRTALTSVLTESK